MEIVDRVDINDKVIGETTKEEAHKNGYIHRVAAVFCFDSAGKILVQHRKKDGLLDHSVGGHVGQGETYDEAAAREMKEELGIAVQLKNVGAFYGDEIIPDRNLNIDHYFGLYEVKLTDEQVKEIVIAEAEVAKVIPENIKDLAVDMEKNPKRYTVGFMRTLNFYIKAHNLPIPLVKVK